MKDFMGTEIITGSYVAYPGMIGHSSYMTVGVVENIDSVKKKLKIRRVRLSYREMLEGDSTRTSSVHVSSVIVIQKPLSDAEVACIPDTNEVTGSNPV